VQIIMHVQIGIGPDLPHYGAYRMAMEIESGCRRPCAGDASSDEVQVESRHANAPRRC
jgi:hypothetical protein